MASHLGLYCLLKHVCPNTYGKYGIIDFDMRWLGEAQVLYILRHWGIQLTLAYILARSAFLEAGKGSAECFYYMPPALSMGGI